MPIYSDSKFNVVYDGQPYISEDGTKNPANLDKSTIKELHLVKETDRPTDPKIVVTGFEINKSYEQVWITREKSSEELENEAKQKRRVALAERWPDPFALLDDILNSGVAPSVKAERDKIKAANPTEV